MSRKQCRRRHYALMNPISMSIAGAAITTERDLVKTSNRIRSSHSSCKVIA